MTNKERVKEVVNSIKSVKIRAQKAKDDGDLLSYKRLMGDLLALQNCLVTECELMLQCGCQWEGSKYART